MIRSRKQNDPANMTEEISTMPAGRRHERLLNSPNNYSIN